MNGVARGRVDGSRSVGGTSVAGSMLIMYFANSRAAASRLDHQYALAPSGWVAQANVASMVMMVAPARSR